MNDSSQPDQGQLNNQGQGQTHAHAHPHRPTHGETVTEETKLRIFLSTMTLEMERLASRVDSLEAQNHFLRFELHSLSSLLSRSLSEQLEQHRLMAHSEVGGPMPSVDPITEASVDPMDEMIAKLENRLKSVESSSSSHSHSDGAFIADAALCTRCLSCSSLTPAVRKLNPSPADIYGRPATTPQGRFRFEALQPFLDAGQGDHGAVRVSGAASTLTTRAPRYGVERLRARHHLLPPNLFS